MEFEGSLGSIVILTLFSKNKTSKARQVSPAPAERHNEDKMLFGLRGGLSSRVSWLAQDLGLKLTEHLCMVRSLSLC